MIIQIYVLKENNVIEDSTIGIGACISGSNITNSKIGKHTYISSYCEVENSKLGNECIIENYCLIKNYNVRDNSKIKSRSCLGESNDSDSRTGQSR